MVWHADSVGGVIFRSPADPQPDALALWPMLFQSDMPDSFNRSTTNPAVGTTASGLRDGFGVTIQAAVGRVNITLQNTDQAEAGSYPRIADLSGALRRVSQALRIFTGQTTPPRAGLVLDLGQTVAPGSQIASLNELIGGAPFPPNSIDIQFQFNVRRTFSTAPHLSMNRLCTYYTGEAGFLNLETAPQPRMIVPMVPIVGLKVDVNTAPETRISTGNFPNVIAEMEQEALSIAADPRGHFQ